MDRVRKRLEGLGGSGRRVTRLKVESTLQSEVSLATGGSLDGVHTRNG